VSEKGGNMPKIINFAKVQKELIQNAFQVFVEKGYYQTKLSDIAQRSNLKRTTFYSYFKNKDAVFEETLLYLIAIINETILDSSDSRSILSVEQAKVIHQSIEQKIGFKKLFRIFMEFWLMVTRGEFTLSPEAHKKIQTTIEGLRPYIKGIKNIVKNGGLSQIESLHYSFMLALPEKIISPEKIASDPVFPHLALYD
jgi:AcrR family transcriptional regulator